MYDLQSPPGNWTQKGPISELKNSPQIHIFKFINISFFLWTCFLECVLFSRSSNTIKNKDRVKKKMTSLIVNIFSLEFIFLFNKFTPKSKWNNFFPQYRGRAKPWPGAKINDAHPLTYCLQLLLCYKSRHE